MDFKNDVIQYFIWLTAVRLLFHSLTHSHSLTHTVHHSYKFSTTLSIHYLLFAIYYLSLTGAVSESRAAPPPVATSSLTHTHSLRFASPLTTDQ
jgi:hypothetical protein